ncbi:MAG: transcription antitermination factor NusB [Luteibaculum sp.]
MGLLHRRHLRLKTLHALYAHFQNDYGPSTGVKNLNSGIDKVYELYISLLGLVSDLREIALERAQNYRAENKGLKSTLLPEELFAENKILLSLSQSDELEAKCKAYKINWIKNDPDIVDKIFRTFARGEEYKAYIQLTQPSFAEDRKLIHKIFRKYIVNNEALQKWLEEKSIYWVDDLDLVAVNVLKTIDSIEEGSNVSLLALYKDFDEDKAFVQDLFRKTLDHWEENEGMIEQLAKNWDLERIALMDRIIMCMGLTEILCFSDIPVKVSLNEYIDLAKEYSTNKSKNFVNGILDKAIVKLRDSDKIHKSGRGLLE